MTILLLCFSFQTDASASIKVAKYSPCEKIYLDMTKRMAKIRATHYAVATTGGRSLKASNTACGFDNGFDTAGRMRSSAINQCSLSKKKFGYPGECKVIESK
jgi:hypothetical protein